MATVEPMRMLHEKLKRLSTFKEAPTRWKGKMSLKTYKMDNEITFILTGRCIFKMCKYENDKKSEK